MPYTRCATVVMTLAALRMRPCTRGGSCTAPSRESRDEPTRAMLPGGKSATFVASCTSASFQVDSLLAAITRRGLARATELSGAGRGSAGDRSGGVKAQLTNLLKRSEPANELDQVRQQVALLERRLRVLEILADYDYR